MPKRTAADFAREAPADGPWQFVLSNDRELTPRPRSHYTYAEQQAEAELNIAWGQWITASERAAQSAELGVTWEQPESLFTFGLKVRFSAPDAFIDARRAEKDGGEVDWPSVLADFDAFWAEVKHWPTQDIHALVSDLDGYYPGPGSDQERSDAATDPAGDAAGKSSAGEASSTGTAASSNGTSPTSASTSSTSGAAGTPGTGSTPS